MLDLRGKKVLFVGGGRETDEKVAGLREAGALVRLVDEFQERDLDGAWLVFAHARDNAGHDRIFAEAERRGIWCNAVDDKPHCAFTMPAVHRQGDLTVAISTNGTAPALAARLRQRFARELGPEYAEFLQRAKSLRRTLDHPTFDERKEAWYQVVDEFLLSLA